MAVSPRNFAGSNGPCPPWKATHMQCGVQYILRTGMCGGIGSGIDRLKRHLTQANRYACKSPIMTDKMSRHPRKSQDQLAKPVYGVKKTWIGRVGNSFLERNPGLRQTSERSWGGAAIYQTDEEPVVQLHSWKTAKLVGRVLSVKVTSAERRTYRSSILATFSAPGGDELPDAASDWSAA